jgi:hypothetical protein
MKTFLRLFLLVLLLNVIRYVVGGPIESVTVLSPMFAAMAANADCFNANFTTTDFTTSYFYNFMLWFTITWIFHVAHPALRGGMIVRSLKIFGLGCLFFASLSAIYMNHYPAAIRSFYVWSIVDGLILFPLLGLANGWLYPRFFSASSSS